MTQPNLVAGGNIAPSRFIKLSTSADNTALQAGANEEVFGISSEAGREPPLPSVSTMYAAQSGDAFNHYSEGDTCLLEYGDDVTAGAYLKADTDGKGVPIASTGTTLQIYGARALQSGAAGTKGRVQVQRGKIRPALT